MRSTNYWIIALSFLGILQVTPESLAVPFGPLFSPAPSFTVDGFDITTGEIIIEGVTAFSDPGGVITSTTVLNGSIASDDVSQEITAGFPINKGSQFTSLFLVPEETEVVRMTGLFQPTTPAGPSVSFDITVGVVRNPDENTDSFNSFQLFAPLFSTDSTFQIVAMGSDLDDLSDDTNVFSSTAPVLSLVNPGGTFLELNNGSDNPWFVGISPDAPAVQPLALAVSIPEPSSLLLAAIGLTAIVGIHCGRRREGDRDT